MTRLDITDSDDAGAQRRRESDQPSIMKVLTVTLGALTIGGLIFTAGYNWRGVDELKNNQSEFVRKDVQSEQLRNMNQSIAELARQVDELRGEMRASRRKE